MPPTPSTTIRRWLSIGLGLCLLLFAVRVIYVASNPILSYIVAGGFLLLSLGLLLNNAWIQRSVVCLCILAAIIIPVGAINPFTAGDMMMQGKDPSLPKMLAWIIPLDIGLLFLAWLLDPPRKNKD